MKNKFFTGSHNQSLPEWEYSGFVSLPGTQRNLNLLKIYGYSRRKQFLFLHSFNGKGILKFCIVPDNICYISYFTTFHQWEIWRYGHTYNKIFEISLLWKKSVLSEKVTHSLYVSVHKTAEERDINFYFLSGSHRKYVLA